MKELQRELEAREIKLPTIKKQTLVLLISGTSNYNALGEHRMVRKSQQLGLPWFFKDEVTFRFSQVEG